MWPQKIFFCSLLKLNCSRTVLSAALLKPRLWGWSGWEGKTQKEKIPKIHFTILIPKIQLKIRLCYTGRKVSEKNILHFPDGVSCSSTPSEITDLTQPQVWSSFNLSFLTITAAMRDKKVFTVTPAFLDSLIASHCLHSTKWKLLVVLWFFIPFLSAEQFTKWNTLPFLLGNLTRREDGSKCTSANLTNLFCYQRSPT